jgi:triacylglycerol lipase
MFRGKDNAAYSLTIQGLLEQGALCETHPATYYFSYVTEQTFRAALTGFHYPEPGMNPFMIPTALYIGHKKVDRPFYPGFRSSEWWHNDGLVSVYSQMFPRIAGNHPVGGAIGARSHFEPGNWYYKMLKGVDDIDIVALFERLAAL